MPTMIDGTKFKELFCKNDDCMLHLGYVAKKDQKPGIILMIICRRCGNHNEWRFGYSIAEEEFVTIKDMILRGGEK